MQFGILKTDGGLHPADKWAAMTAAQIVSLIEIDEHSSSEAAVTARRAKARFELDLADALEGHHKAVQEHEIAKLGEAGAARYTASLDPAEHVPDTLDEAMAAVTEAASGTMFEAHFARPEVQDIVRNTLASHFATAMDIERRWHNDRARASA